MFLSGKTSFWYLDIRRAKLRRMSSVFNERLKDVYPERKTYFGGRFFVKLAPFLGAPSAVQLEVFLLFILGPGSII
jgi:hypothetical protein